MNIFVLAFRKLFGSSYLSSEDFHNHSSYEAKMSNYDNVFFNISAFLAGLFVLEFGADKFVDHTAKVATRLKVPATLIALLTAGAEWEEANKTTPHFHQINTHYNIARRHSGIRLAISIQSSNGEYRRLFDLQHPRSIQSRLDMFSQTNCF